MSKARLEKIIEIAMKRDTQKINEILDVMSEEIKIIKDGEAGRTGNIYFKASGERTEYRLQIDGRVIVQAVQHPKANKGFIFDLNWEFYTAMIRWNKDKNLLNFWEKETQQWRETRGW